MKAAGLALPAVAPQSRATLTRVLAECAAVASWACHARYCILHATLGRSGQKQTGQRTPTPVGGQDASWKPHAAWPCSITTAIGTARDATPRPLSAALEIYIRCRLLPLARRTNHRAIAAETGDGARRAPERAHNCLTRSPSPVGRGENCHLSTPVQCESRAASSILC